MLDGGEHLTNYWIITLEMVFSNTKSLNKNSCLNKMYELE